MRASGFFFFLSFLGAFINPNVGCYIMLLAIYNRMVENDE